MKVLPLHREGWGDLGLEPAYREQPDRKPKLSLGELWLSLSTAFPE